MRHILLILAAILALSMLALPAEPWKWRTHGAVFGTRGISKATYDALGGLSENLDWNLIMVGSRMPDTWSRSPYYADQSHEMTYARERGDNWLREARIAAVNARAGNPGMWDKVSYFMGIAAHYWADVTCYPHHDNARRYYANLYGEEYGYTVWDALHDHFEEQVYYYRPRDPALIVQNDGTYYPNLEAFLISARGFLDDLIDYVMPPSDNPDVWMTGWWGQWIQSRKCEDTGIQDALSPPSGSKEMVDLATTLVYSGWVYALEYQGDVVASGRPTARWQDLRTQYFEAD